MSIYDEALETLNTLIVHDTVYGVYEGYMISEEEKELVVTALNQAKQLEQDVRHFLDVVDKTYVMVNVDYETEFIQALDKLKKVGK